MQVSNSYNEGKRPVLCKEMYTLPRMFTLAFRTLRTVLLLISVFTVTAPLTQGQCADCVGTFPESCKLLKAPHIVFVGTVLETEPKYRFWVSEKLKGVTTKFFELDQVPCGVRFAVGKQYLVFADSQRLYGGAKILRLPVVTPAN